MRLCISNNKKERLIIPRRKTNEEFLEDVKRCRPNDYMDYEFLEAYQGCNIKIKVKHLPCQTTYKISPSKFLNGTKCSNCFACKRKTDEQFKMDVREAVGSEYSVIGKYINTDTKIRMRHEKCQTEFDVVPYHFLSDKRRCPTCFGCKRKTDEEFKKQVHDLVGNNYIFLEPYVTNKTKIRVKHSGGCQHEYLITPNQFFQHSSCPFCVNRTESKGAKAIKEYLEQHDIEYKKEQTFDDLRGTKGYKLRFDFGIYDKGKIVALCEYDGQGHFMPIKIFDNENGLKRTQISDSLKNAYCQSHNIPLLRIPYTEQDNIPNILDSFIHKLHMHNKQAS